MKLKNLILSSSLILLFTINLSAQKETVPQIKIPEGKALVYIYRPAFSGSIINMKTYCDDELIGTTRGKEYIYAIVDPGQHTLRSKASNTDEIEINVQAGETYYVHQRAVAGWLYAATRFDVHDNEKSLRKLNRCRLAKRFEEGNLTD